MPATRKIMGVGRTTIKQIAGSETFAGLDDVNVSGVAQGAVLYYNGSKFVHLNAGTSGQVLTTNGGSANPTWTNKTSATGIVGGTDKMVQFNDGGSTFGGVEFFEFSKLTNNLMISGSAGYSFTARASGSSQTTSGIDVYNYDNDQVLQVGHNNATTESYIWATQTSNNLKFGTNNTKRVEILASNGKVFTSNDLHVSGTLTAGTPTLLGTDSLWAQKGDLAVGTGSDTAQRLSYSATNGQVLTIDTGETTGLKWADPGGVELIDRYHVPVASASTGLTGSRYVSSPIRVDPVGGDWEDGNVVITDNPTAGFTSTTGIGKLALISQAGGGMLGVVTSGSATTIAKFGSITNHTSTLEFIHNGYNASDILSKIVLTSGTTTIGATGSHKFILTGGLGITAQSSKPTDSTTKPAVWVSGTSNLLYLSDVGMVTANSSVLSAGYVPYVSGAAKNGIGNSVIYNDASNNRVGINTASPNRAFDVRGTSLLSGNTKVVGTGEITSTLDVGSNITGTGTATFKTASLTNIVLDPSNRAAFIKLQDSSRTATTASRNPEILLNQVLTDSGTDKADFPTIRFTKAGPVAADMSYTNLGYRIYVSGETGAGSVNGPQAMIWDFNSDVSDPTNYTEKLALTTTGGLRINNAYTLPTAAPAGNGYVITGATDGTTAWVVNSGGGGGATFWSLKASTSNIHYTSGNVGIITDDPQAPLHVSGNVIFGSGASSVLDRVNIGDTTKGIYGYNNRLDFYVASNPRAHIDSSTFYSATSGGPSLDLTPGPAGTANYGFVGDTNTGMTRSAADTLHLLTAGVSGMTMNSTQGVGLLTESIETRQGQGLTISGTTIGGAYDSTNLEAVSLNVPLLGSGAYFLASIGGMNAGAGDNRGTGHEPAYLTVGPTQGVAASGNFMAGGRAVSLVLAGTSGYVSESNPQGYGNFGSLLFHGTSGWTGGARRWLATNAWNEGGGGAMGLGFAQSDNAGVDPTVSGSTPSVVFTTDTNYGTTGKGGLLVGNTTHINSGKVTIVDSDNNKQLTLAHDGSNYTTFKVASSGKLTIDTGNDIDLDTYTGVNNFLYRGTEKFRITAGASSPVAFQPKADAYDMSFKQYDGLEVMRITDGQNVGIGVSGSIPARLTVSGTGAEGEHTFRVISGSSTVLSVSGANVGINTLTPKEPLHIVGDVAFSAEGSTYSGDRIVGATGGLQFVANGGNKMRLNGDGLGINTTSPGAVLHVSGAGAYNNTDGIRLGNTTNYVSMFMMNDSGGLEIDSPHTINLDAARHFEIRAGAGRDTRFIYNGTERAVIRENNDGSPFAMMGINTTTPDAVLDVRGTTILSGTTTVHGTISATAKSFDIPHPDKKGMRLIHGSLEGPEHGVYARGTAKGHGETTIELPDYWKTLVGDDYTLQLTSYNSSNVYIVDKKEDSFTVDSNALTYKFDYVVIGRREEIEVEQDGN